MFLFMAQIKAKFVEGIANFFQIFFVIGTRQMRKANSKWTQWQVRDTSSAWQAQSGGDECQGR